jgi:hypothetical protein
MFTATKFVGIAAATALVLGVAISLPRDAGPEPMPAGSTTLEEPDVSAVSGTMQIINQVRPGETVDRGPGTASLGEGYLINYKLDDERLSGIARSLDNVLVLPSTPYGPRSVTIYLENDGGSWRGEGRVWQDPDTQALHSQQVLHGQDGYEGLDAIMALDQEEFSARFEVSGVIVQGGLPEMPDPAPVRFEYQD